ncbi:MAG TPA: hypothetical protein VGM92_05410 [Candidatus Kapabacteria bacterium]|jgi:hypothetical protein
MRAIVIFLSAGFFFSANARAQQKPNAKKQSETQERARALIQSAYQYQNKLSDSSITIDQALRNWSATARNSDVRKDDDALAIAFGCEAILMIQKNDSHSADSLFRRSIPLFRKKSSKESIIVAYAEFERSQKYNSAAIAAYDEIVHTMDSVPELWNIDYYRLSGYAPYAYAIDASFGVAQIAATDTAHRAKAIALLRDTYRRHPYDAIGVIDVVALHWLGELTAEDYRFKIDLICSRKPELRKAADLFEKKFAELGKL